jgi:hypothetical protein
MKLFFKKLLTFWTPIWWFHSSSGHIACSLCYEHPPMMFTHVPNSSTHFYPIWFAQSSPVLSYICVLKERHCVFRQKTSSLRRFQWADQNGSMQKNKIKLRGSFHLVNRLNRYNNVVHEFNLHTQHFTFYILIPKDYS